MNYKLLLDVAVSVLVCFCVLFYTFVVIALLLTAFLYFAGGM